MERKPPEVTVCLDGSPTSVPADVWGVVIGPEENGWGLLNASPDAKLKWSELDRLSKLKQINYTGHDNGFASYVTSRSGLNEIAWYEHEESVIDLEKSSAEIVSIDCGPRSLTLRLPKSGTVRQLTLHPNGSLEGLRIEAPSQGAGIDLTIWYSGRPGSPSVISGLERICALHVWYSARVDFGAICQFNEIEEFDIRGQHTAIENIAALARFPHLQRLRFLDCYNFQPDEFPAPGDFAQLQTITIDGIRADDAKTLAKRLKDYPGLSIRGKRTEKWVQKNLGNPFFSWGSEHGDDASSRACRIYTAASTALDKLPSSATTTEMQRVMKKFITSFNRLNAQQPFDTIMAEQVGDAFLELVQHLPNTVSKKDAENWFDDWRDF